MQGPRMYPKAMNTNGWWWVGEGSVTMAMENVKWVEHTTETAGGLPGYQGLSEAPTLTYEPWEHKWYPHFYLNSSARALRNDTYPLVNRVDVLQVEISCYCDRGLAAKVGRLDRYVEAIDQQAIDDLGDFHAFLVSEWGMRDVWYPTTINWPAYNGQQTVARLSWPRFVAYSGTLGHMGVPGQIHLDPSSLDNVAVQARSHDVRHGTGGGAPAHRFPEMYALQASYGAEANRLRRLDTQRALLAHEHPAWKVLDEVLVPSHAAIAGAHQAHDLLETWNAGADR